MPTDIQYLTGAPTTPYPDGSRQQPRLGRYGDIVASEFHGKFAEANIRGQIFHFCTVVAGVTLPIFTDNSATVQMGLRNPSSSGVVAELVRIEFGYLSTAEAPGNIVISQTPTGNDTIATGANITVATQAAGLSGQYGGLGRQSACRLVTAATANVPPTVIKRTLGLSTTTMLGSNATQGMMWTGYVFDGTDLVYPGQIILVASTVAAGAGVQVVNIIVNEQPWTPGT